ncbi:MAG: S8 family serine peptidase [Phycisphaeraceae bacterium]|nr:S8 family serine peptidase [Phycisphaeraceae bacterium]
MVVTSVCLSLALVAGAANSKPDLIDGDLRHMMAAAAPGEPIRALVFLHTQADINAVKSALAAERASLRERNRRVVMELASTAQASQVGVLNALAPLQQSGALTEVRPLWLVNAIAVAASVNAIEAIAAHPDVRRITVDPPIEATAPVQAGGPDAVAQAMAVPHDEGGVATTITPGLTALQVPAAWALGYTGTGRIIASLDSGVDGAHPALASRWLGSTPAYAGHPEWAWFDPITNTSFPTEFAANSHGSHTMGSAIGGAPGEQIGVAPGAMWMHAAVIDRGTVEQTLSGAIAALQWIVNPDGNPASGFGVPDVCFNSWGIPNGFGIAPCDDLFWSFLDNAEAAGVVIMFAAGNEGAAGLRRPADRATSHLRTVAVGAINAGVEGWPIADFSSRGPSACTPSGLPAVKPEIAAPGVAIRSSVQGGGYALASGTSMATPHVAGVAALIRQACPDLAPEVVHQIIFDTAVDVGPPGKDNSYGFGVPDALAAVQAAEAFCDFGLSVPGGAPDFVPPGQPIKVHARIVQNGESLVPGSAKVRYRPSPSLPFSGYPLVHVEGDLYVATLPAPYCGSTPEYFAIAEGSGGTIRTVPADAPNTTFKPKVGEVVSEVLYEANFSGGLPPGWTTSGLWKLVSQCGPLVSGCGGAIPTQFAYYGETLFCSYDGIHSGTLSSPPIALPAVRSLGVITATFCYHQQALFPGFMSGGTFGAGSVQCALANTNWWQSKSIDLTALEGQTVPITWSFFSNLDFAFFNLGLMVSSVKVTAVYVACDGGSPPIPGDLNGDGVVNGADLAILLGAWGTSLGDLNGDGTTNGADIAILLGNWS